MNQPPDGLQVHPGMALDSGEHVQEGVVPQPFAGRLPGGGADAESHALDLRPVETEAELTQLVPQLDAAPPAGARRGSVGGQAMQVVAHHHPGRVTGIVLPGPDFVPHLEQPAIPEQSASFPRILVGRHQGVVAVVAIRGGIDPGPALPGLLPHPVQIGTPEHAFRILLQPVGRVALLQRRLVHEPHDLVMIRPQGDVGVGGRRVGVDGAVELQEGPVHVAVHFGLQFIHEPLDHPGLRMLFRLHRTLQSPVVVRVQVVGIVETAGHVSVRVDDGDAHHLLAGQDPPGQGVAGEQPLHHFQHGAGADPLAAGMERGEEDVLLVLVGDGPVAQTDRHQGPALDATAQILQLQKVSMLAAQPPDPAIEILQREPRRAFVASNLGPQTLGGNAEDPEDGGLQEGPSPPGTPGAGRLGPGPKTALESRHCIHSGFLATTGTAGRTGRRPSSRS